MNSAIQTISLFNLALAMIPVVIVLGIIWKWKIGYQSAQYAVVRMLIQLLMIGYFLAYIFESDNAGIIVAILLLMVSVASWIALRTSKVSQWALFHKSLLAITIGGGSVLLLITQGTLNLQPWYLPAYMIPLAGMIFANAMNGISLALERLEAEIDRGESYDAARVVALRAALIPVINSLFAVGLVSLPGMMTGQILSGVSPFIAARYQIMVMCMIFGATGISATLFLVMVRSNFTRH